MTADHVTAPFDPVQVITLNLYQKVGAMHPFTCGHCRDAEPHFVDGEWVRPGEHPLVATEAGWICPTCDYTQDWAHAFMADPVWLKARVGSLRSMGFTFHDPDQKVWDYLDSLGEP